MAWRKSSFSEGAESACVEVGFVDTRAAVRDSKHTRGPMLTVPHGSWVRFLSALPSAAVGGRS
ncbi:MAG TPA: DUF397 domain-containing protein [Actinophytocola sp.]|nr:DUF397 domain-containing protein [Actinophytocola sp.]